MSVHVSLERVQDDHGSPIDMVRMIAFDLEDSVYSVREILETPDCYAVSSFTHYIVENQATIMDVTFSPLGLNGVRSTLRRIIECI